jgi:hypothetical protein
MRNHLCGAEDHAMSTPSLALIISALLCGACLSSASAGEVFRTVDPQGNPIYTDRPATLPAERLKLASASTDKQAAQQRYAAEMQSLNGGNAAATQVATESRNVQKAAELNAEDRGKRCAEARARHEQYMISQRMVETDPESGERRYLTDAEIEAARSHAKTLMDEFCGG